MDPFFLVWFFVLPTMAVTLLILIPIFWFFVVPELARKLTWARFGKSNLIGVFDDAGWVDIVVSRKGLPEGILKVGDTWRPLPTPNVKITNVTEADEKAQKILLTKYILHGMGKPFWIAHAGKSPLMSPATMIALCDTEKKDGNPDGFFEEIKTFATTLPEHLQKALNQHIQNLHDKLSSSPLTYLDLRSALKENIIRLYPPTFIANIAEASEILGMKKAGKQYTPLIIGGAVLVILLILGFIAISYLFGGNGGGTS